MLENDLNTNVHPEIIDFWDKSGAQLVALDYKYHQTIKQIVYRENRRQEIAVVMKDGTKHYWWERKWYSEDKMLRLIKMKVFI